MIRHRAHYDVTVMVAVPASHPGYYPGTLSCSLVTMQFIVCGRAMAAAFPNELQRLNN